MKTIRSILFALLALAWLVPARGEILSTWDFEPEVKTCGDDGVAADISNRVEVLSIYNPADDGSVGILYRRGGSLKVEAALVNEEDFLSRFAITRVPRGGGGSTISGRDASTNETYDGISTWLGLNGTDSGFGEWRQIGDNPLPVLSYAALDRFNDRGFRMAASGNGENTVGRDFEAPLVSGKFEVTAWQYHATDFCGFALYGEGDSEIFRWGVGSAEAEIDGEMQQVPGVIYSLDGGSVYEFLSEPNEAPANYIDYRIAWEQTSTGFDVTLTYWDAWRYNPDDPWTSYGTEYGPFTIRIVTAATAVTAVAAIVSGSGNSMAIDYLEVYGEPAVVPEPATGVLFLLGGVALVLRRRWARGKKGLQGP